MLFPLPGMGSHGTFRRRSGTGHGPVALLFTEGGTIFRAVEMIQWPLDMICMYEQYGYDINGDTGAPHSA